MSEPRFSPGDLVEVVRNRSRAYHRTLNRPLVAGDLVRIVEYLIYDVPEQSISYNTEYVLGSLAESDLRLVLRGNDPRERRSVQVDRFWMVFVDGKGGPTYKHYSLKSAETEAERLSRVNPDALVHVLVAVGACKTTIPEPSWVEMVEADPGKADEESCPF